MVRSFRMWKESRTSTRLKRDTRSLLHRLTMGITITDTLDCPHLTCLQEAQGCHQQVTSTRGTTILTLRIPVSRLLLPTRLLTTVIMLGILEQQLLPAIRRTFTGHLQQKVTHNTRIPRPIQRLFNLQHALLRRNLHTLLHLPSAITMILATVMEQVDFDSTVGRDISFYDF